MTINIIIGMDIHVHTGAGELSCCLPPCAETRIPSTPAFAASKADSALSVVKKTDDAVS